MSVGLANKVYPFEMYYFDLSEIHAFSEPNDNKPEWILIMVKIWSDRGPRLERKNLTMFAKALALRLLSF